MKYIFSGHEKFECKSDWISRFLLENKKDNDILNRDIEFIIEKLGLGKNMINSLNFWLKMLNIYDKELTFLGKTILEKDVFLESKNTIWLLHYYLSKTNTIYNLFFNKLYFLRFKKEELFLEIAKLYKVSENSLKNDIDVFIRLYNQGIFSELNLFKIGEFVSLNLGQNIDDEVFLYALIDVFENKKSDTLSVYELEKGEISLLQIFLLDENSFFNKINKIEMISDNKIEYRESAGFRTLFLKENIDKNEILRKCIEI